MRNIVFLIATTLLTACVPAQSVKLTSPFDGTQAKKMLAKGTNTVKGSALIRQNGGGVVTCAGQEVELVPATEYADERITAIYGSSEGGYVPAFGGRRVKFEGDDVPEYRNLKSKATCDAQGYFKFDNVADGSFFVATMIVWKVSAYVTEGGVLAQRVKVGGGEIKELVLAPH